MERAIAKTEDDVLDNNYPLLIRLKEKAPGTFSHSKNVAAMLDSIASAVGLSEKDLAIAGFYHDIGKIVAPQMFTENQAEKEESGHNNLSVKASLRFITAHVGDTARILVNDENIPLHVIRWCTQHHGTTVARFFYNRAKKDTPDINPDHFRYPGPRPECLESALLMICDILEATSRSKSQAGTLGDIEELVEKVLAELEADEQLDDVELTFGKLRKIKTVLKKELGAQYHKRIDYEDADELVERAIPKEIVNKKKAPAKEE